MRSGLVYITVTGVAVLVVLALHSVFFGNRLPAGLAALLHPPRAVSLADPYYTEFESGSIGKVIRKDTNTWLLDMADDNSDADLPKWWRTWWYTRIDGLDPAKPASIRLRGRARDSYYLPFFSYDNRNWAQLAEADVIQPNGSDIEINRRFERSKVWIARYRPYTLTDLQQYLARLDDNPAVTTESLGRTVEGRDIPMLTITDPRTPLIGKRRIWMHARTHPGEIGGSYVIEGAISELLKQFASGGRLLRRFVFNIVPMHNIDGVVAGNYRTTPQSINLENRWYYDRMHPLQLTDEAPHEVVLMHRRIMDYMDSVAPVEMFFNLHSTNAPSDQRPFFLPHFGPARRGYNWAERTMWYRQKRFISYVQYYAGTKNLGSLPDEGGRDFFRRAFPEVWFWRNFKETVIAMSMESTIGRTDHDDHWMQPDDLRRLGGALVKGIERYYRGWPSPQRRPERLSLELHKTPWSR